MPTTAEITQELRRLLRPDVPSRPFLCRGSPTGCEVILVGINPGTTTPFLECLVRYRLRQGRLAPRIRCQGGTAKAHSKPYRDDREHSGPRDSNVGVDLQGAALRLFLRAVEQCLRFITDAPTVRDILGHLGEPTAPPRIAPARGPPLWDLPDAGAGERDPHAQPAPEYAFDQRLTW